MKRTPLKRKTPLKRTGPIKAKAKPKKKKSVRGVPMERRPIKWLKKELWSHFTLWTKLRYSKDGVTVLCYTCDKEMQIGNKSCQGGHWINKGGTPKYYFHPMNVKPQCGNCNLGKEGNKEQFERRLRLEHGDAAIDHLLAHQKTPYSPMKAPEYAFQIEHYKAKIAKLRESF